MYLQNNKELHIEIQRVGCLYLSMLRIFEILSSVEISIGDVNQIWRLAKQNGSIDTNNNMKEMDVVFKLAKKVLGLDRLVFSVGILENEKRVYWNWTKQNAALQDVKFMIENLKTPGLEGNHFILCNDKQEVLFDSYSFKPYRSEHIGRFHLINHF